MKLADLPLEGARFDPRFAALELGGISLDSRKVKRGDLFVAVPGTKSDGLSFVPQAVAAGAAAILAERKGDVPAQVAFIEVANARRALAL
ncbi:MAG TPA: Mur ligase domain-containing protein, partial [Pseudolabrys sp.]|nr:Mur ligase domain-containing protein [Pseudolabrys sp.]